MLRGLLASFKQAQGHVNAHSHVLPCASPKNMHIGSSLFINTYCAFKGFNEHLRELFAIDSSMQQPCNSTRQLVHVYSTQPARGNHCLVSHKAVGSCI